MPRAIDPPQAVYDRLNKLGADATWKRREGDTAMPRPKPSEPWVQVALRLTPAQAAKVQTLVDNSGGFSFSGAIRHMIECYEPLTREQVHEIMLNLNERVKHEPLQRWKAKPGSLLKKR